MVLELKRLEQLEQEGVLAHSILDDVRAIQKRMKELEQTKTKEEEKEWER